MIADSPDDYLDLVNEKDPARFRLPVDSQRPRSTEKGDDDPEQESTAPAMTSLELGWMLNRGDWVRATPPRRGTPSLSGHSSTPG